MSVCVRACVIYSKRELCLFVCLFWNIGHGRARILQEECQIRRVLLGNLSRFLSKITLIRLLSARMSPGL